MLGHKTILNKFELEIISSIFSDHNGRKLGINNKKKMGKIETLEAKQHVTKQLMGHRRKRISKNTWRQMKTETQPSKIYRTKEK